MSDEIDYSHLTDVSDEERADAWQTLSAGVSRLRDGIFHRRQSGE